MSKPLEEGDPAPEFRYTTVRGASLLLSELWAQGPALILWLRHFGWPFYSETLAQLRETLPRFEERGIHVGCVVQGTTEEMARFCGRHGVEAVCIPDPKRESYRAMGLERTTWFRIAFPSAEGRRRRAEAKAAGFPISLKGTFQKHSDVLQLPGAALVARGGRITWLHRGSSPSDIPSPNELLELTGRHLSESNKR